MAFLSRAITTLAFLLVDSVDAFWRMNCAIIQTGRVDPLVNPGAVAAHAHTIVGGSNIGVNATFDSLLDSECTSCEIETDKSAYWTPLLYYQYPNGSFIEVPHGGSVVYYLARGPGTGNGGADGSALVPYPEGFKILTGDKSLRSYDNVTMTWGNADYPPRRIADRISFVCLPDGPPLPEYPFMFNTTCANGMRAQIVFQSCWDGIDLYKQDNSHVAYLSNLDSGICPPTHPIQLPTLFIETNYAVAQVPDLALNPGGRYVFSQGDPTGYGFHADFQNGWEPDVLAEATRDCLVPDNFGQISYCPSLYASQTNGYPYNCPEQPQQIDEKVHGLLDKLPGCITITNGPDSAPPSSMNCPASVPQPSISTTVDSTPRPTAQPTPGVQFGTPNQVYLGCYNDTQGSSFRTLNAIAVTNYSVMTPEWCQNYCKTNGYRLSGVEYAQECHCDNYINPTSVNGQRECRWYCGGTNIVRSGIQELCGGLGFIDVFNNTDPNFDAFGSNENTAGNAQPYQPAAGFGANYLGCYTDNSAGGRTLTGDVRTANNMTLDRCAAFCQTGYGYQYYGLEFSTQCYCGNSVANSGTLLTPTSDPSNNTCQMRCGGAGDQICGGPNALSLYNNTGFTPPTQKATIGKYRASTCLSDPNTTGRSLQGASMTDSAMTEDKCVKFCLGKRYRYAGIEFGSECYCGNAIVGGGQQMTCPATTIMRCPGNQFQYCGGPGYMSLFHSATL